MAVGARASRLLPQLRRSPHRRSHRLFVYLVDAWMATEKRVRIRLAGGSSAVYGGTACIVYVYSFTVGCVYNVDGLSVSSSNRRSLSNEQPA